MDIALIVLLGGSMAMAAAFDALHMRIPNAISVVLAVSYAPLAALAGQGWSSIGVHYVVGLAVLAAMVLLFTLRVFGGGDGKLIAAAAVWFGPETLPFLVATVLAGGVLALVAILCRRAIPNARHPWLRHLARPGGGVPFALAILAGGLWWISELPVLSLREVTAAAGPLNELLLFAV